MKKNEIKNIILAWMVAKQVYISQYSVNALANAIIPFIELPLTYASYREIVVNWTVDRRIIVSDKSIKTLVTMLANS